MLEFKLQLRLWIENQSGQIIFGPGRVLLLRKVKELGSLNKAAKSLGMSYRAAWGKLKASEKALGKPLLVTNSTRGASLTPFAEQLISLYDDLTAHVQTYANQHLKSFNLEEILEQNDQN